MGHQLALIHVRMEPREGASRAQRSLGARAAVQHKERAASLVLSPERSAICAARTAQRNKAQIL